MINVSPSSLAASTLAVAAAMISVPAAAQVDPSRFLDQFEATFGKFAGYRRSGAKGVCATGEFVGSAEGRALSTSSAFGGKPAPLSTTSMTAIGQDQAIVRHMRTIAGRWCFDLPLCTQNRPGLTPCRRGSSRLFRLASTRAAVTGASVRPIWPCP